MMVLGPHVRQNTTVDRRLNSLDLVPTLGALLGFPTPDAQGKVIFEVI
jgi:arylsulfatase A-like enzyme